MKTIIVRTKIGESDGDEINYMLDSLESNGAPNRSA